MNWNYTEFKTYVLLEAAYSDMDFSDEEKDVIKGKLSPDTFDKVYEEFLKDSDFERIEKIRDAAKIHCDTLAKKEELLDKVRFLFESDGQYDTMEKNLMMYLKKLI